MTAIKKNFDANLCATDIKQWAQQAGFQQASISRVDTKNALTQDIDWYSKWLENNYQAGMSYLERNQEKRSDPKQLVEGTISVVSLRMNYLSDELENAVEQLDHPSQAYVSRYALGRDYHKLMRKRLQQLANQISEKYGDFGYRVFVDSAPVLEKALARNAGLGWIGKHTVLLNRESGSWFFLAELFTDLPLPADPPQIKEHCGTCTSCIDVCPTQAIVAPYKLDAGKCISYLTIENKDVIPVEFRKAIGNRIFGCDDCQLFCPWNKFIQPTRENDFAPRHNLNTAELLDLFNWSEDEFNLNTQGSPIRRTGYQGWLRNIAVALGNADFNQHILNSLNQRLSNCSELVSEHIQWAITQQQNKQNHILS